MSTHFPTNPNDAAFPLDAKQYVDPVFGLTIRQHFAALAMQGFASNPACSGVASRYLAEQAVLQADLLIEALNEGTS